MSTLTVYLTFEGNCEQAFAFYKTAFRKEFDSVLRYGEAPSEHPLSEEEKNWIINIALSLGEHQMLMGCDRLRGFGAGVQGNNYAISIGPDSKEEADRLFKALSEGGTISQMMHEAFWGDYFGMFTDRFGIHWMINYVKPTRKK